jgi:integrase
LEVERPRLPWWTLLPRKLLLTLSPIILVAVLTTVVAFVARRVWRHPVFLIGAVILTGLGVGYSWWAPVKLWLATLEASDPARLWDLPDLSLMMLATGCRIGECLAIGWNEIDLDRASVEICWRLVRQTGVGLRRLPSTKSGQSGERVIPLPSWAVTMLKRRRLTIAPEVQAVFPDTLGGWRDPSNVRRVWRQVRDQAQMEGLVSHMLRKTVASFLDNANVSKKCHVILTS